MYALFKKELQSYYYSPFAYVIGALFLMIFSLSFISGISNLDSSTFKFSFPDIFYNNFFFFIFLIPALTMRTFAEERKAGTEVLLMSSPLPIYKIVLAKFLALAVIYLFLMILSLFYPLITILHGNVVWSSLLCGYIGFYFWGLVCIAIGILMSALTESPIIAAILGEAAMIVLLFLDNLKNTAFFAGVPVVSTILTWLSTEKRFVVFSQGLFRLSDLIFFFSLVGIFLAWTVIVVEKRRWSRS